MSPYGALGHNELNGSSPLSVMCIFPSGYWIIFNWIILSHLAWWGMVPASHRIITSATKWCEGSLQLKLYFIDMGKVISRIFLYSSVIVCCAEVSYDYFIYLWYQSHLSLMSSFKFLEYTHLFMNYALIRYIITKSGDYVCGVWQYNILSKKYLRENVIGKIVTCT